MIVYLLKCVGILTVYYRILYLFYMINQKLKNLIRKLVVEELGKGLDYSKISDVKVAGIDLKDAPKFVDAYIESGTLEIDKQEFDSCDKALKPVKVGNKYLRDLTEDELEELSKDYDFVHKHVVDYLYEVKAKKGKKSEKRSEPKPVIPKKDLDQTKDDKIDAGDAVVASRKAKIALSKGDKKDAAYYEKIRKIVNRRIGQKAD